MKFTLFLTILATLVATVTAFDTNASRMARGLNPMAPVRRATGTDSAAQHYPSGRPHGRPPPSCSGGSVKCCDSVSHSDDPFAQRVAGLAGLALAGIKSVGLGCTPISVLSDECSTNTVCCDDDDYNGLISANCNNFSL